MLFMHQGRIVNQLNGADYIQNIWLGYNCSEVKYYSQAEPGEAIAEVFKCIACKQTGVFITFHQQSRNVKSRETSESVKQK